jgi:hypothetical protein
MKPKSHPLFLKTDKQSIVINDIYDRKIRRWMTGECFDMAIAIQEKFPRLIFVGLHSESFPDHVGVLLPDNRIADARGIMTPTDFAHKQLGGDPEQIFKVDIEVVKTMCGLWHPENQPMPVSQELKKARSMAKKEIIPVIKSLMKTMEMETDIHPVC